MRRRLVTALALAFIGLPAILFGGFFYFVLLSIFILGAAWEYIRMFQGVKFQPGLVLMIGGVALILITRMFLPGYAAPVFSGLILIALAWHLIAYERGRDQAALDFGISVAGIAYLGWIGAYLLDIRNLHEGGWWFMLVLPTVWLADSGAYSIGAAYGKHKLAPRLSPKKSWEGYIAGILTGALAGAFFVFAYTTFGNLKGDITILQGAVLGFLLGLLTPFGDLGESLFKRQAGLKDSSQVIPGHGGFFDRIDSWLWGAAIGYYYLVWFIL
jgi:phosphatidate cytidylyltransferase